MKNLVFLFCLGAGSLLAQIVSFSPARAVDTGFRAYFPQPSDSAVGVKVETQREGLVAHVPNDPFLGAAWIWHPVDTDAKGFVKLRARLVLPAAVTGGAFAMSCDNGGVVTVNGRPFAKQGNRSPDWETLTRVAVRADSGFHAGTNLIEVVGENIVPGDAGFLASWELKLANGATRRFTTGDAGWEVCREGQSWVPARRIGDYGCAPWGIFNAQDKGRNPAQFRLATRGTFALAEKPAQIWLVCDEVEGGKAVDIQVNGQLVGAFARPPHRLDITPFVQRGTNVFTTKPFKIWNPRVVVTGGSNTVGFARRANREATAACAARTPYQLTCEYLREPLGVVKPRFFWKYHGERPAAFTLDVATSVEKLAKGDVFHGTSATHLYVEPALKLAPFTRYWWRVGRGQDQATASFVTGIENWRAPFFGPHWKKDPKEYWRARRTVELHGATSVILSLCSRGYHKLYVNGREVEATFGPNRSHIEDGYLLAETYDVTGFVREGANEIEVIVADAWARICGKRSCLSVDGRAVTAQGVVTIDSAEPWRTARVNDRSYGGWCGGAMYGGEHLYDVRQFSDEQAGHPVKNEGFRIACDISPRDHILKELPAVSVEKIDAKTWRVDFGEQFTGFVRLKLKGRPGTVVGFDMSDHVETRRQFKQHYEFEFCAGGKGAFASLLNWTAGRYAHLEGIEDLNPEDVTGFAVGNFTTRTGSFTGDEALEKAAWIDNNTLVMTSFSGVTVDCPHRERLGYGEATLSSMWGDGLPYYDSAAYYFADLLKWASSQEPNGHIPHVSPDFQGGGGTFWSNFPIYGFADYWPLYPDTRLREVMRPVAAKWLDYLHAQVKDGLVRKYEPGRFGCLGDWAFPDANVRDWGQSREALFFNNCSYAWAILRALEVEGLVPDPARRAELQKRHAALVAAIEKEFYLGNGIYLAPHARYQSIALVGGVAAAFQHAEATERALLDIVEKKGYVDGGSPSYTTILRVMCRSRRGRELIVKTFRRHAEPSYLFFVDQGYSTIPEYWNFGFHFKGSMMHTCFTGGAGALLRGLAGFKVKGDEITVEPFLSPLLPNYEAQMETLYGTLKLKVRPAPDGKYDVEVTCPSGCRGRFRADTDRILQPGVNRFLCRE